MTTLQRIQALDLWRSGLDTYQISRMLNVPEHEIYNSLSRRFERSGLELVHADVGAPVRSSIRSAGE